VVCTGDAYAKK